MGDLKTQKGNFEITDDFVEEVCNNQPALQLCIIMVHIYFCIDKNIALGNVLMMHWLTKILHWSVSILAFDYSTADKYLENYASRI